jgi:hypothetical protein
MRLLVEALLPQLRAASAAIARFDDPRPFPLLGRRTPYDETRYLMALQKRRAPLLKFAADAAP